MCSEKDAQPGFPRSLSVALDDRGAVQLVKHAAVNHLLLPLHGHCARAELPEELLILGVKRDVLDVRVVLELVRVFGVDHVGLWHPGGLQQARLQSVEVDAVEELVASWVIASKGDGLRGSVTLRHSEKCLVH